MKIVNVVLAIGTLIILGALITLGIKAFYPAPVAPNYPLVTPAIPSMAPCALNDTKCEAQNAAYQAQEQAAQDKFNADESAYVDTLAVYNKNLFIVANVVGIIVFVVGFLVVLYGGLLSQGVPIGIMMAGLWSIIYGYGASWGSVGDKLKFIVGLIVAVVFIGGSMWLMQRRQRESVSR